MDHAVAAARPGADLSDTRPDRAERRGDRDGVRRRLADLIGDEGVSRYFDGQADLRPAPGRLDVVVPSEFTARLLARRYESDLRKAAAEDADSTPGPEVRFVVDASAFRRGKPEGPGADPQSDPRTALTPLAPVSASPASASPPSASTGAVAAGADAAEAALSRPAASPPGPGAAWSAPTGRYRLDAFVVGDSNRLAHTSALALADPGSAARVSMLFIHGPCGVGKTHLLHGVAQRYRAARPGAKVRCVTAEVFTNEFIAAVQAHKVPEFRRAHRGLHLLCIDDVHFLTNKSATQTELLHTLDSLQLSGSRLALASDAPPRQIRTLSQPLVSRFLSGMVVPLAAPDADLRDRLIRELALRRGLDLDAAGRAALASAAGRTDGSVRELEGLLTSVEAMHRLASPPPGGPVGASEVRRALGLGEAAGRPARPSRPVPVAAILDEVCRVVGVDRQEVVGSTRHPRVVLARSLAAYLSRRLTSRSYPEIARALGRPNHSSVITAAARYARQVESGGVVPGEPAGRTAGDLADLVAHRVAGR